MLTREHAIIECRNGRAYPDRLFARTHAAYPAYAARMLALYRAGIGRRRDELHREVMAVLEVQPDCPPRRAHAFAKLLDEAGIYARDGADGPAAALRRSVFRSAAACHPLVAARVGLYETEAAGVKAGIAAGLGRPWTTIAENLYADVFESHRLIEFRGYAGPQALLARYNVAQVQASLFDAVEMRLEARADFKEILRYAKLAGLMHVIEARGGEGYRFTFGGAASALRQTHRYGAAMARFLPSLLPCRRWEMEASLAVRLGSRLARVRLALSSGDGLHGARPAWEEFDSTVEEAFARKWGGGLREGWGLEREAGVLHRGQHVFVPDFRLRHQDGRQVFMEIVGYWTPEYLESKRRTLELFRDENRQC